MELLPAIDIRGGRCVRLRQGDYGQETIYGDDPVAMAQRWVEEGADWLHLVDLDGAKAGRPINTEVIRRLVAAVSVPCELGGGLRSEEGLEAALELGVQRAIVGTQAVKDPDWFAAMVARFPNQLVLGLDARAGKVATAGWLDQSEVAATDLAGRFRDLPLAAIVYTDIARDGMLTGPNVDATCELQQATPHLVIASGGIAVEEDVITLAHRGIRACILGRSLYEGTLHLPSLVSRLRTTA